MADTNSRSGREDPPRVACFATQGRGSGDEARILWLLQEIDPELVPVERGGRARSVLRLWRHLNAVNPELVVMEGTGIAGGVAVIGGRFFLGRPYIVSSGDAIGPFISREKRLLGFAGAIYERLLCRLSAGFVGWSPYLVGRALTFGAPRCMCAPNWADFSYRGDEKAAIRQAVGIPVDALVFGLVGSLNWSKRVNYCYGLELVEAARRVSREDVYVLIVGDGDGRLQLEERAGPMLGKRVRITGRVPHDEVPSYLAALDVASLPQSVDQIGSFRYTTKISEYLAARLPVVTGQIPLAYDLDGDWMWRLPGDAPWEDAYVDALAQLMRSLRHDEAASRRPSNQHAALFSSERQRQQVTSFVHDVVERERRVGSLRLK